MTAVATTGVPVSAGPAPERRHRRGTNPLIYFVALLVVGFTLGPVLYAVLGGFRSNAQLAESPAGLPDPWVWDNYIGVLTGDKLWTYGLK